MLMIKVRTLREKLSIITRRIRVLVEKRCMSVETFEYHDLLGRGGYALHMLQNKDPLPETD